MQLFNPGQRFSFTYEAYDQNPGLFVAFSIYDLTTGTPVFVETLPAALAGFGAYIGSFIGGSGKSYAIIGVVYTDGTYTTVDLTRSPSCDTYQATGITPPLSFFVYGSYDQNALLNVKATIYNVTTGTPTLQAATVMTLIAFGVYFGTFTGVLGDSYQIVQVVYTDNTFTTPDPNRSPSADSFEGVNSGDVVNNFYQATLIGQQNEALLNGQQTNGADGMITFTQGDTANLQLTATDGKGVPINITGGVLTTYIKGPQGQIVSFPNSQHTIDPDQVNNTGDFVLALSTTDTASCAAGMAKEIITQIVIGASTVYFRGVNQLEVFLPIPLQ